MEKMDGSEVAIIAIVALMLFKEAGALVRWALDKRNDDDSESKKAFKQIADLHEWHAKEDDDGIKIWYVRRSFEEAIFKLNDTLSASVEVLRELVREIREDKKLLKEVVKKLGES